MFFLYIQEDGASHSGGEHWLFRARDELLVGSIGSWAENEIFKNKELREYCFDQKML
ncbi:hypothetical protein ATPR_0021 [Acetobacter tropicalis NBRC 101654]|uniref:Uncharacterized protein n=1 Tax=Acetobacter tropicalis NBRC 101654 TaxID=749388 RepID=F7V9H2_9PROT|nr:hypothetical protein ATPR_0021 [Acetobacter tropicalis NBRC 101654]